MAIKQIKTWIILPALSCFFIQLANANIVIGGTRVIFPSEEKEVTLKVENLGDGPVVVQAWLDKGDTDMRASPDKLKVPFVIVPSTFLIDPKKGQTLVITNLGEPLPADKELLSTDEEALSTDKETLLWLNVREVPPEPDDKTKNYMQIAIRSRLKFIFRPAELEGRAEEAPAKVTWQLLRSKEGHGFQLTANNPTPYYVNLDSVGLKINDKHFKVESHFVPPYGSANFAVPELKSYPQNQLKSKDSAATHNLQGQPKVEYSAINDYGGSHNGDAPVQLQAF